MRKSKLRVIISLSIITLLILGSVGSFGNNNNVNKNDFKVKTIVRNSKENFNKINLENNLENINLKTCGGIGTNSYDNFVVTNKIGDESYPTMIRNGYNCLVAYEYQYETENSIYLRYSTNYGQAWSNPIKVNAIFGNGTLLKEINSPSLSIEPLSNKAYGMFKSPLKNSAVFGYIEIPNILDPGNIYPIPFDWTGFPSGEEGVTYAFWDFDTPQIITYKNTVTPWVIALTGSTNYSIEGVGPCTDSPMFCFNDLDHPEKYVTLTWYSEIEHCSNISLSRNYSDSTIYGVCEIKNGLKQNLFFFYGNPTQWYNGNDLNNKTLTYTSSLTNPNINVANDKIYIVTDSDSNGIILYTSSDNGKSWDVKNVTKNIIPPGANPNNPMIYCDDEFLLCTYIESNNIFLTGSNNNGLNWSDPIKLNSIDNSVIDKYRFSNLIDDHHILWTDNRSGNNDIYSVIIDVPKVDLTVIPESVAIESEYSNIPIIRTKNWITFTIKNNGNISVEKTNVYISYICQNETSQQTNYKATIYYLPSGAEESFKRPLFRLTLGEFLNALIEYAGLETITIEIEPKYEDANPFDNSHTISVTYKDIFPRLGFLESIFILF